MSASIIIIGIILIAMFVLPFFLVGIGKNHGQKQLKRTLLRIANEKNNKLSNIGLMSSAAIGIDETTNDLFFVNTSNGIETIKHIKLSKYKSCKIINISRTIKDSEGNHTAIDRLDLELVPFEKGNPNIILEFFNADGSVLFTNELSVLKDWEQIINNNLPKKN